MKTKRGLTTARAARRPRLWTENGPTTWAWLTFVSLLSFLLHLPFFGFPMINDEGGYAYVADRWLTGRGDLYDDIWVSRPQGIFVAYGLIFRLIGDSTEAIRLGAWLVSIATLGFVWLFARDWAGRRAAMLATLVFAIVSGSPAIEGFTANSEVFMALPAAAGSWLLLRAGRNGWGAKELVGVGVLACLAAQLKPAGVVMIPVGLAYIWLVGGDGIGTIARRGGWLVAGSALAAAPALIHGAMIGWNDFIFASLTYRLEFQSSATVTAEHHMRALASLFYRTWPLLALVAGVLLLNWRQTRRWGKLADWRSRWLETTRAGIVARSAERPARVLPTADGDVLLRLWFLGCLVGVAMGGDWWYHYLIQAIAPFAIWFAPLLLGVARRLAGYRRPALLAAALLILLSPYTAIRMGHDGMAREMFDHTGYPVQEQVAAYIREHTSSDNPIFVAFDQAALYYLTDRPGTYRYMYDQELRAIPSAEEELVRMLTSGNRPLYVIGTKQRAPFPDRGQAFWNTVAEHYYLETMVRGVPIFRAKILRPMPLTPDV
ncbi:MAG: ArnT family glycosyltransferase [Thermomicrobiales bacterium]